MKSGRVTLDFSKLQPRYVTMARVTKAVEGLPDKINGLAWTSAFIGDHPEYDSMKGTDDVRNMVYGKNCTDEDMLIKFETWCASVKSQKSAA